MIIMSVDELTDLLRKGYVAFVFEKKSGEKREARGTLREEFIPREMVPVDKHLNPKATNPKYFDLDKNAWRSLSYDASTVEVISVLF